MTSYRDFARHEKWALNTFDEFVEVVSEIPENRMDVHFRPQYTFLTDKNGNLLIDFLGRFEQIHIDIKAVIEQAGFPKLSTLEHRAKSIRHDYKHYYSEYSKRMVEKIYKTDLEMFSYSF